MSKDSVYMSYRREDKLYEIHDMDTGKSYWIKKGKKGNLVFKFRTDYPVSRRKLKKVV